MAPLKSDMMKRSKQERSTAAHEVHTVKTVKALDELDTLVLWRKPVQTTKYCLLELYCSATEFMFSSMLNRRTLMAMPWFVALLAVLIYGYRTPGPHTILFDMLIGNIFYTSYWTLLGIASSAGLGFGLHTFVLYLGPHIMKVSLAAFQCGTLDFPSPPYPDEIICPSVPYAHTLPSIWAIIGKVRLEAFFWGLGTALGELPPYFMARSKRLSGGDDDDCDDDTELAELKTLESKQGKTKLDSFKIWLELKVKHIVERAGFFGILLCASIPNPAFDLAGLMCGYCLVPFWTFFGATAIGKAIVKTHLQIIFVVVASNETFITYMANALAGVHIFGPKLKATFLSIVHKPIQRNSGGNILSKLFDLITTGLLLFFGVSIVNMLAKSYYKRLEKQRRPSAVSKRRDRK